MDPDIKQIGRELRDTGDRLDSLEEHLSAREKAHRASAGLAFSHDACVCGDPSESHSVFSGECTRCGCARYQRAERRCPVCLSPDCRGHPESGLLPAGEDGR